MGLLDQQGKMQRACWVLPLGRCSAHHPLPTPSTAPLPTVLIPPRSPPQAVSPGGPGSWPQVVCSSGCPQQADQGGRLGAADRLGAQAAGAPHFCLRWHGAQPGNACSSRVPACVTRGVCARVVQQGSTTAVSCCSSSWTTAFFSLVCTTPPLHELLASPPILCRPAGVQAAQAAGRQPREGDARTAGQVLAGAWPPGICMMGCRLHVAGLPLVFTCCRASPPFAGPHAFPWLAGSQVQACTGAREGRGRGGAAAGGAAGGGGRAAAAGQGRCGCADALLARHVRLLLVDGASSHSQRLGRSLAYHPLVPSPLLQATRARFGRTLTIEPTCLVSGASRGCLTYWLGGWALLATKEP